MVKKEETSERMRGKRAQNKANCYEWEMKWKYEEFHSVARIMWCELCTLSCTVEKSSSYHHISNKWQSRNQLMLYSMCSAKWQWQKWKTQIYTFFTYHQEKKTQHHLLSHSCDFKMHCVLYFIFSARRNIPSEFFRISTFICRSGIE